MSHPIEYSEFSKKFIEPILCPIYQHSSRQNETILLNVDIIQTIIVPYLLRCSQCRHIEGEWSPPCRILKIFPASECHCNDLLCLTCFHHMRKQYISYNELPTFRDTCRQCFPCIHYLYYRICDFQQCGQEGTHASVRDDMVGYKTLKMDGIVYNITKKYLYCTTHIPASDSYVPVRIPELGSPDEVLCIQCHKRTATCGDQPSRIDMYCSICGVRKLRNQKRKNRRRKLKRDRTGNIKEMKNMKFVTLWTLYQSEKCKIEGCPLNVITRLNKPLNDTCYLHLDS